MKKVEQELVIEFLDHLSDRLGNAGCNDLQLEATPENIEMVTEMAHWAFDNKSDIESCKPHPKDGRFWTTDWMLVDFLKEKLKKEWGL